MNLYAFIETKVFTKQLHSLADDEVLFALQNELLENPKLGDVIQGTNGARKGRIGNLKDKRGKRSSFRYIYYYYEIDGIIYLLLFYSKSEQDDLTKEQKRIVAALIKDIKEARKKTM